MRHLKSIDQLFEASSDYKLWIRTGPDSVEEYKTKDPYSEIDKLDKEKKEWMIRPPDETAKQILTMFKDHKKFDIIAKEREGKKGAISVTEFNMKVGKMPDALVNAHDTALNEPDDLKEYKLGTKTDLPPGKEIWTGQEFISGTWLKDTNKLSKELPVLIEDSKGRWWVADGHHRIAWARSRKMTIKILLLKKDDVKEIDDTWYSNED